MDVVSRYLQSSAWQSVLRLPLAATALFLGGLLWVGSLWLPAFQTNQGEVLGYWLFITGWMGFAVFQFGWYANLVMLLGVLLMNHLPRRAALLALTGIVLATQSFWLHALPGDAVRMDITGLSAGFWLWYASMLLLGIGILLGVDEGRRTKKAGADQQAPAQ